jgi:hypothetical protein
MFLLPLSVALGAALLVPVSDPVPTLNVKPSCQAAAQMGDSLNARLPQCLESERTARVELEADWAKYPSAMRKSCTSMASLEGLASYVVLLECLIMEKDATEGQYRE